MVYKAVDTNKTFDTHKTFGYHKRQRRDTTQMHIKQIAVIFNVTSHHIGTVELMYMTYILQKFRVSVGFWIDQNQKLL